MSKLSRKKVTQHSKIEKLVFFGARVSFGPAGLILMAEKFLFAAKTMAAVPQQIWSPVERFLTCRSIELSLKAFLSMKGRPLTELAGGVYGHDLQNLLLQADADGLCAMVDLTDSERAAIDVAYRYYLDKVFEYPALTEAMQAYPGDPVLEPLLSAASHLVAKLLQPCIEHNDFAGEVEVSVATTPAPLA
jgi:hypothetical protein